MRAFALDAIAAAVQSPAVAQVHVVTDDPGLRGRRRTPPARRGRRRPEPRAAPRGAAGAPGRPGRRRGRDVRRPAQPAPGGPHGRPVGRAHAALVRRRRARARVRRCSPPDRASTSSRTSVPGPLVVTRSRVPRRSGPSSRRCVATWTPRTTWRPHASSASATHTRTGVSRGRALAGHARAAGPGRVTAALVRGRTPRTSWRPSWRVPSSPLPSWPEPSWLRSSWPVPSWLRPSWPEPSSRVPSWPEPSSQVFLAVVFLAGAFLAADVFLAGAFLAAAFFAGAFFAAAFFAGAFFAAAFFAGAFFAVVFFAADFLAAEVFLVVAAPAAFFAAAAVRATAGLAAAGVAFSTAARVSGRQLLRTGHDVLELRTGLEVRNRLLLRLDPLSGRGVADPTGVTHLLLERTEPGDGDLLALRDLAGDGVEHRIKRVSGRLAVALKASRQGVDQLTLVHKLPFRERRPSALLD